MLQLFVGFRFIFFAIFALGSYELWKLICKDCNKVAIKIVVGFVVAFFYLFAVSTVSFI